MFLAVAGVVVLCLPAGAQVEIDSATFGGLKARSIGPALMSGRVAAIDAVPEDPLTIYVGAASGGVWKSRDGGLAWKAVFDDHPQSIGAIAIDPSAHDTVWVGTGEAWTRNSVSVGKGVYKTTDGGDSWQAMGLEPTERIVRILVDPTDGDRVFVCATGQLWSANEERGVYRTDDGGENWELVLAVDADTGCSDLAMDPQTPDVLYAGMWQFRRYPDFFESGGPGSGLYKSTDGGDSWNELTNGLPEGTKGRIAVAVAPSRPNRVYSVVEGEDETALYRSDDLGNSWENVNNSLAVRTRPFYFAYLVVDPDDFNRVYKPGFYLGLSTDGGKSFSSILSGGFGGGVHSDHHALWINPTNPHELILGTDGGVYMSYDRGSHFRMVRALPLSQFYEVSYDMDWPYNVYGGLQDNGSWKGPSRGLGGVQNRHWEMMGGGDGFHTYRDPHDPNIVYAEFQGGNLLRYHLATNETKQIYPLPAEGESDYRFNWNTALHLSPNTPGTIYYGGQYLFRSADRGESWEKISPDLTTNDPQRQRQLQSGGLTIDNSTAENNTTIYSISESRLDGNVIWVGTDDGLVQLTRDGGETWTNVTANIPDLPAGLWVSHVEASPHDKGTAHVTVDGHRSGDMATYVYRTTDFGATWSPIGEGIDGFAHVIVQDPVNPELLYVGTEFGLFLSLDSGGQWARFDGGIPQVPVRDIDIHPREHDLIVGTHGRGIYILDDLSPLRALTTEVLDSKLALLPARDSVMVIGQGMRWFGGHDEFVGANPPEAASIFFYQNKRHIFGDLKIEIYDQEGELITTIPAPKVRGLNRADWEMRFPPPKLPPATNLVFAFQGPRVPEGTYTYKLIKGKETFEGEINLVPDPRSPHSAEDRKLQQTTALELYEMLKRLTYLVESLVDAGEQSQARLDELGGKGGAAKKLEAWSEQTEGLRSSIVSTADAGWLSGDEKLREKLGNLFGGIVGYDGRPTQSQLDRTAVLGGQLDAAEASFADLTGDELAALNSQLEGKGLEPVRLKSREEWESDADASASATSVSAKTLARLAAAGLIFPLGL
jgi:photosystem II stability/assembly factor-like uncharacterized protein